MCGPEVDWAPLLEGGGHENGRRSSTENVAGIVGMGAACALAAESLAQAGRLAAMRDKMEEALTAAGAVIFGREAERLPNTSLFGFPKVDGDGMAAMLDQSGFAVATGAACSSMKEEPSHVLLAMGEPMELARTAVRVSLPPDIEEEKVARFTAAALEIQRRLLSLTSLSD